MGAAPRIQLELVMLPTRFAVSRLAGDASVPVWAEATAAPFLCIARTADELSIVCEERLVPTDVRSERGWRAFRIAGALPFELTGILASLTAPLAAAGIGLFAVSTFDTDYVLVRAAEFARAREALEAAGHRWQAGPE
ncbi:MAG: ACT domain-containing protein [Planctomycetota bacterium]